MLRSPIHHTFAPLAGRKQCLEAMRWLLCPWQWRKSFSRDCLRAALEERFGAKVFLFSSGREGLAAFLLSMELQPGDEVIVQGYTCVAVVNAIRSAGAVPRYADIDPETLNLTVETVKLALSPKTRALICQHTFGIPADLPSLRSLCDRERIVLIEDCAHIIADARGPRALGMVGDATMLSFGRDKAISGVTGGAILLWNNDLSEHMRMHESQAVPLPALHVARLLLYPLLYALARPLMGLRIGFGFLTLWKALKLLPPILTQEEKEGTTLTTIHPLPEPCAALALHQWKQLEAINNHRRMLTALYCSLLCRANQTILAGITPDLPLQKFPMFARNAPGVRAILKKKNIHLSDGWTGCVVCQASVALEQTAYVPGSDPEAERASTMILNLPTHPGTSRAQAEMLCSLLLPLLQASGNTRISSEYASG